MKIESLLYNVLMFILFLSIGVNICINNGYISKNYLPISAPAMMIISFIMLLPFINFLWRKNDN